MLFVFRVSIPFSDVCAKTDVDEPISTDKIKNSLIFLYISLSFYQIQKDIGLYF